ncbi:MAG: hypothetical protein OER88_07905 [Planctomycetota bacterium]|nr:hypothetical protein [Planctomycetota bacterium]
MQGHWGHISRNLKRSTRALVRRRGKDGTRHLRGGGLNIPFNRSRRRREPTWLGTLVGLSLPGLLVLLVFGADLSPRNDFSGFMVLGGIMISIALTTRAVFARGPLVCRVIAATVCAVYPALFLWHALGPYPA